MSKFGRADKQKTTDDIIGPKEAADILGVSRRHVLRLASSGVLDAKKLGREWAISRQSVLEYKAGKEAQE